MNRDDDMHFVNASKAFGIPIDKVTEHQRRLAKTCAFGAPNMEAALENLKIVAREAARRQEEADAEPRENMEVWVVHKAADGLFSIVARSNLHGNVRKAFDPLHGSPSHNGWLAITGHPDFADKCAGSEVLTVLAPNPVEK